MMRSILLCLALLLAAGPTLGCDFNTRDRWLLAGYYTALAADLYTTHRIIQNGGIEKGPFMSDEQPSKSDLILIGLVSATAVTTAACYLPDWRLEILGLALSVEAFAVVHNSLQINMQARF